MQIYRPVLPNGIRLLKRAVLLLLPIITLAAVGVVKPTQAASLPMSSGCAYLNSVGTATNSFAVSYGGAPGFDFYAGETVTMQISDPEGLFIILWKATSGPLVFQSDSPLGVTSLTVVFPQNYTNVDFGISLPDVIDPSGTIPSFPTNWVVSCAAAQFVPPDGRINSGFDEGVAVIYPANDASGNPDLQVYCLDADGQGYFGGAITQADIAAAVPDAPPATDMLVKTLAACSAPVSFYVLSTGEYQINIGPGQDGKTTVMIFTGLPPTDISLSSFGPG